jgi:hypothetical protein
MSASPSRNHHTFPGQLDQRHPPDPEDLPGQGLVMVQTGEITQIGQHVEDPVVLHDNLIGIG